MSDKRQYRLRIDAFSVESLPMGRLAEYMAELAQMLGQREHVHFSHIENGSAVLVSNIDDPALPKVAERVQQVRVGGAPKDAMQAFRRLDDMLAKDNAVAVLIPPDKDPNIIEFPGRTRPKPMRYGPFREYGTLDGVLFRIGGRDETIPVWLKDGDVEYHCQVREEVARRMAPYYLAGTLRVHGSGKWMREEDGTWNLQQFDVEDFELLDDSSLASVVKMLRAVEGSRWHESDDAVRDALGLRSDNRDHH